MGSYTFSGEKFDDFSRIFPDPTLIYINLTPTKQMFVLKAMFWVSTRSHAEKPDNARELENTCKPDIHCALVAQWTFAKVMKEQWEKNECFHTFCKNFKNFYSLNT